MLEPPDVTWTDEQKEKVISNIPLKRMGNEKDIANAVKFVASSKYMTGQIIKVDGGRSLSLQAMPKNIKKYFQEQKKLLKI